MRVYTRVLLVLVVFTGVQISARSFALTTCGFSQVQIQNATALETEKTCEALNSVSAYFKGAGIQVDPKVTYIFHDRVEVKLNGETYTAYGYYDTDTLEIHMIHFESGIKENLTEWNQSWDVNLATSFLVHETTHMYFITYMGDHYKYLPHVWHEAVAYTVQFETMNSKLKSIILNQNTIAAYEDPSMIHQDFYEMSPAVFAKKSFLSITSWGGAEFIKKLAEGKINGVNKN